MKSFRRYVSIIIKDYIAGLSGLGCLMFTIFTTFTTYEITILRGIFAFIALVFFVITSYRIWLIEYKKVEDLQQKISKIYSGLNVQVKDITLSSRDIEKFTGIVYLTIRLSITNTKNETVSLNNCRLLVEKDTGQVEGELQQDIYLEEREHQENMFPVFLQGITKNYTPTFRFYESDNDFVFLADNLENKPFTILLTDGYTGEYKVEGITPKDLLKDFKF